MSSITPIYCQECGRANGRSAKRCIWCGLPIIEGDAPLAFDSTRVEIDYIGGIERLEDPAPVTMVVSPEGIEVIELMPGSRIVKIPAGSIIEAKVVDASEVAEASDKPWWSAIGSAKGKRSAATKKHDYLLNVKYYGDDDVQSAIFRREDKAGLQTVNALAWTISLIARRNKRREP
jgi:hypothetical protein